MFWKKTEIDKFIDFVVANMKESPTDWAVKENRVYNEKLDLCFYAYTELSVRLSTEEFYTDDYPKKVSFGKSFGVPFEFNRNQRKKIYNSICKISENIIIQNFKKLINK